MSFSDFGVGPSSRAKVSNSNAAPTGGLAVISETLLQYQRNVGILEGIVQSLQSNGGTAVEQYEAQNHVLSQLEEKITSLMRQAPQQNTALIKLQRDFQRVKLRATQQKETAARKLNAANSKKVETTVRLPETEQSYQQQQQLQLMEDRLHESIMRERETEIRNINQGMHTVNEIYKDLATIVSEQQESIDQIETQMEDSKFNAENGLRQVEKANEKFGNSQCNIM